MNSLSLSFLIDSGRPLVSSRDSTSLGAHPIYFKVAYKESKLEKILKYTRFFFNFPPE